VLSYGEVGLVILVVVVFSSAVWRSERVQRWQVKNEIRKQRARNKEQQKAEDERYDTVWHAISARIHAIAEHLYAQSEEQTRQDNKRSSRENKALIIIATTAALAFISDGIFYYQLNEMRNDGRAWVGPTNATVTSTFKVGEPISLGLVYNNTGRTPATHLFIDDKIIIFSIDEWNKGEAAKEIIEYQKSCMAIQEVAANRVAFPTLGFTGYNMQIESFDKDVVPDKGAPPIDKTRVAASQDFIDGKAFLALAGCFAYVSNREMRHTSFCFLFQNKKTKPESLNICTVGNDAD
jgi:hypothetical protein